MLDDPQQVEALMAKLKANLPIEAQASPELVKLSQQQGWAIAPKQCLTIENLHYMGDEGGICCAIRSIVRDKEQLIVSLTHLEFDPIDPLAAEVKAYQRRRVQKIALQNRKGFAEQLLSRERSRKKKGSSGFGKN